MTSWPQISHVPINGLHLQNSAHNDKQKFVLKPSFFVDIHVTLGIPETLMLYEEHEEEEYEWYQEE